MKKKNDKKYKKNYKKLKFNHKKSSLSNSLLTKSIHHKLYFFSLCNLIKNIIKFITIMIFFIILLLKFDSDQLENKTQEKAYGLSLEKK